ncbi:hypothetical protein KC929_01325 [Patescibacteria group bacterium]|nr:hypothetical protein [Patescibacteria group bacterium]
MEVLEKLFGNKHRVKIMRLFLFNDGVPFDIDDLTIRSKVNTTAARKEIHLLLKLDFIKKKTFTKKIEKKSRSKKRGVPPTYRSVKREGWMLNPKFELIRPLKMLLIESELIDEADIVNRIRKAGSVQLLLLSGLFVKDEDRKLDLLVVGDKLKRDVLDREIAVIESEVGHELCYAAFTKEEFLYRLGMYDKLVRDILENDHRTLIKRLSY